MSHDSPRGDHSANAPIKLPYQVIACTSFDDKYPPSHLEAAFSAASASASQSLHGWHSARNCSYPQSLILSFGYMCQLTKLQLLSHQSKIPKSIEVFTGKSAAAAGPKALSKEIDWTRLGYFSLESNAQTEYKARELKTVPINVKCSHLKLIIKGCHTNPLNTYNQCAIAAINVVGVRIGQPLTNAPMGVPGLPNISSLSLNPSLSQFSPRSSVPAELDLTTTQYLLHLTQLKAQAIDSEDYDEAKKMKVKIDRLNSVIPAIVQAERRKREAIEAEDFDAAKQLKAEVERLREAALMGKAVVSNYDSSTTNNYGNGDQTMSRKQPRDEAPFATPQQPFMADDDRPLKPSKAAVPSFDDQPLPASKTKPSREDNLSLTVNHAAQSPLSPDDRPIKPTRKSITTTLDDAANSNGTSIASSSNVAPLDGDDRPIKARKSTITPPANINHRLDVENADERALPASKSSYAFDDADSSPPAASDNDAPAAEPIPSNLKKESDPIIEVFGLEITQQLFSKQWQLRIDAANTISAMLTADTNSPSAFSDMPVPVRLSGVGRVIHRLLTDKVTQVFVAGARLLETCMKELASKCTGSAGRDELRSMLIALSGSMIDKLNSSSPRERDGATQILTYVALHRHSPPHLVPTLLLGPLKSKESNNPTPIRARSLILAVLIAYFGANEQVGLSLAIILKWCTTHVTNKDAGVRDAVINAIAIVSQHEDRKKIDKQLKQLPRATLDTLEAKLADVSDGTLAFPRPEPPNHAYVDRPPPSNLLPSIASPPQHSSRIKHSRHGSLTSNDETPLPASARAEKKPARQSDPPLSARREKAPSAASTAQVQPPPLSQRALAVPSAQQLSSAPPSHRANNLSPRSVQHTPRPSQVPAANGKQTSQSESPQPLNSRGVKPSARPQPPSQLHSHRDMPSNNGHRQQFSAPASPVSPPISDTHHTDPHDDHHREEQDGLSEDYENETVAPHPSSPSGFQTKHAEPHDDSEIINEDDESLRANDDHDNVPIDDTDDILDDAPQCQFCGLTDPSFTDESLDLHYWQSCPMLLSCPQCEQVVEIPSFTEHRLTECEAASVHCVRCESCFEAVEERDWAQHELRGCVPVDAGEASCPLCHSVVEDNDEGWKHHILDNGGCPGNSRTVEAHGGE